MNISGKCLSLSKDDDLSAIIEIDRLYFPRPWKQEDWENLPFEHHILYAWQDKDISGFALFHHVQEDETAHLLKISILPELRGSGLAKIFWAHFQKDLESRRIKSVYLEVESINLLGVGFYQKLGFQTLRETKGYYSDGTSALIMSLTL